MARSANIPEPINWNQVKALFESLQNDIGILAEEVRGLNPRLTNVERKLDHLVEEVGLLRTAFRSVDQRVTTLESVRS